MGDDWVPPKPEVQLTGNVIYRCHECKGQVDGPPTLAPLLDGRIIETTRAYHPEHAPKEVSTDGS